MEIKFGEYRISNNKGLISLNKVCELLKKSYWANNRNQEKITKSIENSIGVGIFFKKFYVYLQKVIKQDATLF